MERYILCIMFVALFFVQNFAIGSAFANTSNDVIYEEKKEAVEDANNSLQGIEHPQYGVVEGKIEKGGDTKEITGYANDSIVISLDDCIKKGLENNPQIQSAINNSKIYKTYIGQAWANYFPTFTMTNGYTRNRFFSLNFAVQQRVYNYYNAMNFSGSWMLFDFGKTKATADMAKRTYESTLATLDETINTVIFNVKSAYFQTMYALEKQQVYKESVENYELQLKQANSFYYIGKKPKIDVTMAQYNLGKAQLGYIEATNEVKLAIAQLNNAMGLQGECAYKILEKLSFAKKEYNFKTLVNSALENKPQIIAYRKKAQASEMLIRSAKRAFTPNLTAVGAYQIGGGAKFSDDYGWTIGAQFEYPTTNLMLLKKQIDTAQATHQKDLSDLKVLEQDVYLQVKQGYISLQNAQESIPVTALSLKQAKEQFYLAKGRYKAGVGEAIELKDSENTYLNARLDYLGSLLRYNVSLADLERIVGCKLVF